MEQILQKYRVLPQKFTRISNTILLYEEKNKNELIFCPLGILAQAGYSQGLTAQERADLMQVVVSFEI
jgi:hypothetical protein